MFVLILQINKYQHFPKSNIMEMRQSCFLYCTFPPNKYILKVIFELISNIFRIWRFLLHTDRLPQYNYPPINTYDNAINTTVNNMLILKLLF
jgi:hypothetical protein